MLPAKLFRFGSALPTSAFALLIFHFQSYAQFPGSRPPGLTARAAAARAAATTRGLTAPPHTATGAFVTFDVPGAVNGTAPAGINNGGVITGGYGDNIGSGSHGFVRAANGGFLTFDVPGALNGTFPSAINDDGAVTGYYSDNIGSGFHGFVRAANGVFSSFDAPGSINGTVASVINAKGEVAGFYFDVNFVQHSFIRDPNGALTAFDPPAGVNGSFPSEITPDGVVLGIYFDANSNALGFLRDSSGGFQEISGPGGLSGLADPYIFRGAALTITPAGEIAGTYFQPIAGNPFGGNYRVFLLSKSGQYTTFDAATYPPCCIFSSPAGSNPAGTITGSLNDGFSVYRGFLRASNGTVTVFDVPGAGTGLFQGTMPIGITPGGVIAGVYVGANDGNFFGVNHSHGFLFQPQ